MKRVRMWFVTFEGDNSPPGGRDSVKAVDCSCEGCRMQNAAHLIRAALDLAGERFEECMASAKQSYQMDNAQRPDRLN